VKTAEAEKPAAKPAEIKVAAAKPQPVTKPAGHTSAYYVQAGAYSTEERAQKMAASLDRFGARVSPATVDGRSIFRVRIGPFLDREQANVAIGNAQSLGYSDVKIVAE
jgi:cell division protein FtsN